MKKINSLEQMRQSIGSWANASKETLTLKKNLQSIKGKEHEQKMHLDRINAELNKVSSTINSYYEKQNTDTEGERSEQEKVRAEIEKVNEQIDKQYDLRAHVLAQWREEQKVMDSYTKAKRNIEWAKRVQLAIEREEEEKKEAEAEEKKRKANQMSEWEVNKT